ncbi:MAG: outer membrane beta-barrel protein [Moraxellaceae bacterium]|jgi:outer membrane protein|nr:outer membrane beta-barrel protein [Moraxellaceae bacterium]MBP9045521.1 outer membrane beta-barrel protein [Moraxellaceae bacterium]MBP9731259.1 outer membrane beta-barrel protein [Moraxellaceae bacterium]HQX89955.1 OmpW family outer membrane protein [Moraxellaceae bacterium]
MRIKSAALLAAILAATAGQAMAYETGDIVLRAGVASVNPDVTDNVAGGALKLDVDNNVQLGLTGTYFLSPTIGVQLLAATPFKHDITAAGTKLGSTKHLPPTVTLQWYPSIAGNIHPYVGAGLNYTMFFEDDTPGADLELDDSLGLALEVGVDIDLGSNLVLNAAIWKIDINTDVNLNGVNQGELEIDPLAFMVGIGYKF